MLLSFILMFNMHFVGSKLPHIAEYISIGSIKDDVTLDSCKNDDMNIANSHDTVEWVLIT